MTNPDPTINSPADHRNRGRPALLDRKRARNLSISDEAWRNLEEQLQNLPVKTASELVEKIGLGQILLTTATTSSPLADIPICRRLKALMENPIAVFGSILAFVRRTCGQLNLEPTDDRVINVTLKASTIVFYTGYTHPDLLINNPSALIKWLCYEILQADCHPSRAQSPNASAPEESDLEKSELKPIFCKISHAFDRLEMAARSPEYKALKMKTIDGLTIKQISRIFKLQKHDVSKVEVSRMIKQGLVNFRELFYNDLNNPPPSLDAAPSAHKQWVQQTAHDYLQLALQRKLMGQALERLQEILLATTHDPYLDFWLNEIDYCLRDRQLPALNATAPDFTAPDVTVRDALASQLEDHLQQKKKDIDRDLAFCQTAQEICQTLELHAAKEAGTKIPVARLLAPQGKE